MLLTSARDQAPAFKPYRFCRIFLGGWGTLLLSHLPETVETWGGTSVQASNGAFLVLNISHPATGNAGDSRGVYFL